MRIRQYITRTAVASLIGAMPYLGIANYSLAHAETPKAEEVSKFKSSEEEARKNDVVRKAADIAFYLGNSDYKEHEKYSFVEHPYSFTYSPHTDYTIVSYNDNLVIEGRGTPFSIVTYLPGEWETEFEKIYARALENKAYMNIDAYKAQFSKLTSDRKLSTEEMKSLERIISKIDIADSELGIDNLKLFYKGVIRGNGVIDRWWKQIRGISVVSAVSLYENDYYGRLETALNGIKVQDNRKTYAWFFFIAGFISAVPTFLIFDSMFYGRRTGGERDLDAAYLTLGTFFGLLITDGLFPFSLPIRTIGIPVMISLPSYIGRMREQRLNIGVERSILSIPQQVQQQYSKPSKNFRLDLFVDGEDLEAKIEQVEENLGSDLELVRVSDTYQAVLHYIDVDVCGEGVTRETAEENARTRSPIASEPNSIETKLIRTYDAKKRQHVSPSNDSSSLVGHTILSD